MRAAILLCALLGVTYGRPQGFLNTVSNLVPSILRYDFDNAGVGGYDLNVETSDGFKHVAHGEVKNEGRPEESLAVSGQYSYVGDDGKTYSVEYIADENGFQPAGEHLPKSAGTRRTGQLGIPSAAVASLAGGGLG